jgi:hypothetical protein
MRASSKACWRAEEEVGIASALSITSMFTSDLAASDCDCALV